LFYSVHLTKLHAPQFQTELELRQCFLLQFAILIQSESLGLTPSKKTTPRPKPLSPINQVLFFASAVIINGRLQQAWHGACFILYLTQIHSRGPLSIKIHII